MDDLPGIHSCVEGHTTRRLTDLSWCASEATIRGRQLDDKLCAPRLNVHGMFEATIIERTIEGRSELMYAEASSPAVKMHISYLVTGP